MAPKVDVRSEPREFVTVLFVLHKGTKVTVLQQSNDWSEVKLSQRQRGLDAPCLVGADLRSRKLRRRSLLWVSRRRSLPGPCRGRC
jgi:hypothetical protein